jgi:ABC-2 type transport system ATP-binding protein
MLEVTNLTKNYGAAEVLHGIGFRAEHGRVLGILGPNGAGKSTAMNIITGFVPKSGGSVSVCGIDTDAGGVAFKKHIGYLPEATPLHVNMTVDEFLEFSSDIKNVPKRAVKSGIAKAAELTGLSRVRGRLIRNLSKGYKQRVGIAQALIGFPEVLILDEPTSGLDPTQLIEIRRLVRELGREHTVIFSSHILAEAESVCDRVVVLYKGRVLAEGRPSELIAKQSGAFRLSAAATPEQVAGALAAAGIEDAVVEPLNRSLEDEFVRLIARAEQEEAHE